MPDIPNAHAVAAMLFTVIALWLFSSSRIRLEISSVGLIAVLAVAFAVFPYGDFRSTEFFSGFGHEALIAVCALMVVGHGLVHTGALRPVGRVIGRYWGKLPFLSMLVMLILAAVLSAFINNTPIVVLFLPILISVCLRTSASPSKILLPMGFATLLGGASTTIGTSTNLLVVSVAADLGLERMQMFDFLYPAAIAGAVGIVYLWLIAPLLLPERDIHIADASPRLFEARLHLEEGSAMVGKTLGQAIEATGGRMRVTRIRRRQTYVMPLPDVELREGDRLRVTDTPQNLKEYEDVLKAQLYSETTRVDEEHPLSAPNQMLAEVAVVQGSRLDHTNLRDSRFLSSYQLVVLALHRNGLDIWKASDNIQDVLLQPGDILLVQGPRDQIAKIKQNTDFLVLDGGLDIPSTKKAPLVLAILAGVVVLAATGVMPIAVSAVAGAAIMLLTRCINVGSAIRAISPSVFFVVVASLALGRALTETGATEYVTDVFLFFTYGAPAPVILGGLMLLLAVLTNVVSNNAAAVIGTPIAISIAQHLNLPPEPFVLAVLFGANMSYATPMAYQTNLLVMSAGSYKFLDFVRVGVPLAVLMLFTLTWVLTAMYL